MLPVGHTSAHLHDWRLVARPLLALFVIWFILRQIYRTWRPKAHFFWGTGTFLDRFQIVRDFSRDTTLGQLNAVVPERHHGAIVFLEAYFDWGNVRSVQGKGLDKVVWRYGISPKHLPGDVIILGPTDAGALLRHLDTNHSVRGNYVVLPHASAEEAERFALLKLTLKDPAARREALAECGFFYMDGDFGPFEEREFPEIFQKSVTARLRKLYDGNPPAGADGADFASLLRVDPLHGSYGLLAERRPQGPRLWALAPGTADARCIEFSHGGWSTVPGARTPSPLRPMSWPKKAQLALMMIVFVLPGLLIAAPFWPLAWSLDRWMARRREAKLRRMREALQ